MVNDDPLERQLAALFVTEETGAAPPRRELDPSFFSVLTVCTGNICRSPLAAGLLRMRLGALTMQWDAESPFARVSSAGLGAVVGAPADASVRSIATGLGIDLDAHRAHQFDARAAESAHLVLTATREQRDEVVAQAPLAASRSFSLVEFARLLDELDAAGGIDRPRVPFQRPGRAGRHLQRLVGAAHDRRQGRESLSADDIDDPYRRDAEMHRRVADQIDTATARIAACFRAVLG